MSRSSSALSLFLLFTVASCAAPAKAPEAAAATTTAVDPVVLKDAIQAREKEWSAAFLAGNAAGIAALYTDDGASIESSGEWSRGRAGIAKQLQVQFDTLTPTAREDIAEEVIPAGDYALEIGHYSYQGTGKTSKAAHSASGRYMVLWRKDADGVWRLHRDIGSEAPPKKS
jgi:uncharacterized protein (TIGR02246 family)